MPKEGKRATLVVGAIPITAAPKACGYTRGICHYCNDDIWTYSLPDGAVPENVDVIYACVSCWIKKASKFDAAGSAGLGSEAEGFADAVKRLAEIMKRKRKEQ